MKRICICCLTMILLISCASTRDGARMTAQDAHSPAVSTLMTLDEAIDAAVMEIETNMVPGTEIAVYKIAAGNNEVGEYLADDLNDRFSIRKKLVPLAREKALTYVDTEHQFQMSGLVSDASAVGIGHYLGAKVVITGTFDRYADFSQIRLRAVDVGTSAVVAAYTARIRNSDTVLANITAPLGTAPLAKVSENALEALNKGKDLLAEGKLDVAITEFNRVLAINANLEDAYFYRGYAYHSKQDYDRAIADWTQVIRLNPNHALAYVGRGLAYHSKQDYDRAIADWTQAIRLSPNNAFAHIGRGLAYGMKGDHDRAIADFTSAMRLNPNHALAVSAYSSRGEAYHFKQDYDRAIVDYTQVIRLNPNYTEAYSRRGDAYVSKKDYDRAITDFTSVIRLNPNFASAYYRRGLLYDDNGESDRAIADYTQAIRLNPNYTDAYTGRGIAYYFKKDYNRAIADVETALKINPNNAAAKRVLEMVRQTRGW